MTGTRQWNPDQIRSLLISRGFDIEGDDPRFSVHSITARRERSGQSQLFVVDSSGRFRAEMTVPINESRRSTMIGSVPIVVLTQNQRILSVSGSLPSWTHLPSVLIQLDQSF